MAKAARWQTEITSLKDGIKKIYENKDLHDVVFTFRGQQHFKVHKLVLAARSSEFARMLLDPNAPREIFIEKESVTPTGFGILIRFVYTDELGTDDKKSIIEAYLAAEYYQQKALQQECEKISESWNITKDEVCKLLDAGLNIPKLKAKCIDFIEHNASEVISSPSFINMSFACLNAIVDSGALNSVPVLHHLNRIVEWGASRHTVPVNYTLVRVDFLSKNPPLLAKLGIEKLDLKELAGVVRRFNGLLTDVEVVQFMQYHADKSSSLPAWCIPVV